MSLAFYRLQQLISPSLPIGAFTYSQGMEWAVEKGWIVTGDDLHAWLDSVINDSLLYLELPILHRLFEAYVADDQKQFAYWNAYLLASRETSELRAEEKQRAYALYTVLKKLPEAGNLERLELWREDILVTQTAGFALASVEWGIDIHTCLQGYLWSWLENMVTVAVKLVPLGQSDGQRVLFRLSEHLQSIVEQTLCIKDEELGASTMALAIASSLHETQYCRLFRS